jgi:hypothetical protein
VPVSAGVSPHASGRWGASGSRSVSMTTLRL